MVQVTLNLRDFTCLTVILHTLVQRVHTHYCDNSPPDWPPYIDDEEDCPKFGDRFITQIQVPWGIDGRAWYTLPPELDIRTSNIPEGGVGVFSKTFIPMNTWLGEYEGETFITDEYISDYAYRIYQNGTHTHYTDAGDARTSCWTRWLNCPRNYKELTVIGIYCKGKVFIISLKNIYPGQELMLYYGDDYARNLGINPAEFK